MNVSLLSYSMVDKGRSCTAQCYGEYWSLIDEAFTARVQAVIDRMAELEGLYLLYECNPEVVPTVATDEQGNYIIEGFNDRFPQAVEK